MLRRALNQAVRWGDAPRNVAALVDAPKRERHDVQPFDLGQTKTLFTAIREDRDGPLFLAAAVTGLRKGELLGLRWSDVDLDAATITVRMQAQRIDGKKVLVAPKTDKSRREIALPALVVDTLSRHRVRQLEERQLAGSRWQDMNLVFPSTIGTPLDSANVTHAFHDALQLAELPRQRFHDLRHGAASLMFAQDEDARTIIAVLGHSQISTTMDLYTHMMPSTMRDVASRMDAFLVGSG